MKKKYELESLQAEQEQSMLKTAVEENNKHLRTQMIQEFKTMLVDAFQNNSSSHQSPSPPTLAHHLVVPTSEVKDSLKPQMLSESFES
jgi:hypothetical protein